MYGKKIINAGFARQVSKSLVFIFCVLALKPAMAQPQPIAVGAFDFLPSLSIEYIEDDNLFRDASNVVDSSIIVITPEFDLTFDNGISGFSLNYAVEDATFSDVSSEDYTDQRLGVEMGTVFGGVHRIEVSGFYHESHDRGSSIGSEETGAGAISNNSLDAFEDKDYQLSYLLGTEDSLFNFSLLGGEFERRYTNNRFSGSPSVAVNALQDREESRYEVGLFWNVSPDLRAGISYSNTEIEYIIPQPTRDGEESLALFRVTWEPSENLALDLAFGQTERSTDANGIEDTSDYWDFEVEWNIYSYSTLSASAARFADEGETVLLGFSVREQIGATWRHEWTDRLETVLFHIRGTTDYRGGGFSREDDTRDLNIRVAYQFRRWLNVAAFYQDFELSSTAAGESYDQTIIGLEARLTL